MLGILTGFVFHRRVAVHLSLWLFHCSQHIGAVVIRKSWNQCNFTGSCVEGHELSCSLITCVNCVDFVDLCVVHKKTTAVITVFVVKSLW